MRFEAPFSCNISKKVNFNRCKGRFSSFQIYNYSKLEVKMFFKHCLIFLSLCFSLYGPAKLSDLDLDDYDYDQIFQQLKASTTSTPIETNQQLMAPSTIIPTTPMPENFDYSDLDYSMSYDDFGKPEGKKFELLLNCVGR